MKIKLLFFSLIILAMGGSLFGQGEGTPVRTITGSGAPGGSVAHIVGTEYIDISASPNALYVCSSISVAGNGAITCNWTAAGGGGITSVSSLPATCTPGVTANVTLSVAPFQEYQCGPLANQWFPFNPLQVISPISYGAKWDAKVITDAAVTNSSNTVTCPNSDCNFTSADLGKIVFATTSPGAFTTGCNGAGCGAVVVPQGFICTINNANSINIGLTYPGCAADNATAGCAVAGNTTCPLIWGTQDDSTAIQNAATAAWTNGNSCKALLLPSGFALVTIPSGGLFSVTIPAGSPCGGSTFADSQQAGALIYGAGPLATTLIPLPATNFANCTALGSANACMGPPPNTYVHDFGVQGYGQSNSGLSHAVTLFGLIGVSPSCTSTAAWNMAFGGWDTASTSTSSKGFAIVGGCGVLYAGNIVSEAFGNTNCYVSGGNTITLTALDCFGSSGGTNGASLNISAGTGTNPGLAIVNSTGGMYWGVNPSMNAAANVILNPGSGAFVTFNSFSDNFIGAGNGTQSNVFNFFSGTATVNLTGSQATTTSVGAGTTSEVFMCNNGATACNISAYASNLLASGSTARMFFSAAGAPISYFDACKNNVTLGGAANTTVGIFGSCSITGTAITAAKLVLSAGWGTTAAWTGLSGSTQQVSGTITASGTGQAANPTITYTFPTAFLQTPTSCFALQVGGTQAGVAIPFTPSGLSATGVTFTYNGTPVAGNTLVVQIQCWNP
jgi:hypothetical protein